MPTGRESGPRVLPWALPIHSYSPKLPAPALLPGRDPPFVLPSAAGKPSASVDPASSGQTAGTASEGQPDLLTAVLADLESEDERCVQRALSLVDKLPVDKAVPPLVQMLRHPKDEIGARAAPALLLMNHASTLEPLYLYCNARGARA